MQREREGGFFVLLFICVTFHGVHIKLFRNDTLSLRTQLDWIVGVCIE